MQIEATWHLHARLPLCSVWLFATPWTRVALQAPLYSRQEYWSELPFPIPGDLPDPGTETVSCISCIGMQILYIGTTWETHMLGYSYQNMASLTEKLQRVEEHASSFAHGLLDWVYKWRTKRSLELSREALLDPGTTDLPVEGRAGWCPSSKLHLEHSSALRLRISSFSEQCIVLIYILWEYLSVSGFHTSSFVLEYLLYTIIISLSPF